MRALVFKFGLIVFLLMVLFQLSRFSYRQQLMGDEWLTLSMGVVFIVIGVAFSKFLAFGKKNTVVPEGEEETIDLQKIADYGLSDRELDVLKLMAEGLSNKEIGERLFVSESTIKTHASRLFVKLDVKRRTQAVAIAKELKIIV